MKLKITSVKIEHKICEVDRVVSFSLKINNILCEGVLSAVGSCISNGMDMNELKVGRNTIKIANNSGHRFYAFAIHGSELVKKENQKDFRFTGAYFQIPLLQKLIAKKLLDLINNPSTQLTEDFKSTFFIK